MNTHQPLTDPVGLRLELARQIAVEAGRHTLRYFRQADLAVMRKGDDSPVTQADREAEQLLRERITAEFPDDAIVGEELGQTPGSSGYCWVLDPIDGTKSFIHGVPLYGTIVAVLEIGTGPVDSGIPQVGVIYTPGTNEIVFARTGGRTWYGYDDSTFVNPLAAKTSSVTELSEALILTSEVATFTRSRERDAIAVWIELQQAARLARTWGDAYGYLMVAIGRAEVMLDAKMHLWDAAALKPIIEGAGGRFGDWQGRPSVHSGDSVAANSHLFDTAIGFTRSR